MHFNVSQLMKESSGSKRGFDISEGIVLMDDGRISNICGNVSLVRTDLGVWVTAMLDSMVECTCSRCLTRFEQPIHIEIDEEFFPLLDIVTGASLRLPEDTDGSSCIDRNHILDLTEALRQYSALSVPMKPTCSDDCAGLCPTCGASLNGTACECDLAPLDSGWAPLLKLAPLRDKES